MPIKAPRGTYDIMPPVSRSWQVLEERLKEVARLYGYQEIRTPLFEYTELFERGVGEGTDIVSKEMYTFYDKSGRSLTLRPEMTASCARALIEHSAHTGLLPIKWFYYGPMFRYDRPQWTLPAVPPVRGRGFAATDGGCRRLMMMKQSLCHRLKVYAAPLIL